MARLDNQEMKPLTVDIVQEAQAKDVAEQPRQLAEKADSKPGPDQKEQFESLGFKGAV